MVWDIREARWPEDRFVVETMFREYIASLGVDLGFQDVERELAGLPGKYARPEGVVLIAADERGDCGAVGAFRTRSAGICEMKRLYVGPERRGQGLGRRIAEALIERAKTAGFSEMLLDSLASQGEAQRLYRHLGFKETSPYYDNPLPGTVYMSREL